MVSIDNSGKAATFLPKLNGEIPVVPSEIQDRFDIIDAYEKSNWILRQADLECDISKMRMLPLLHRGIAVGALIFEHRQGVPSVQQQRDLFEMPATVIAAAIAQAVSSQKNSCMAERFVAMLSTNRQPIIEPAAQELSVLDGIAEMAAGAAHELNNPLAVISGRTQLLAATETDPEKKKTLAQIQSRAEEISSIVSQMMRFAQPQNPSRQEFSLAKIVTAAGELVAVAHRLDSLQMSISGMDDLTVVNVDPDQIVAALTAVMANSLESYEDGNGSIEVTTECPQKPGMLAMLIRDHGRGMDSETVARAAMPFFSAKPAGRKRGMGLANAQRLISANGGAMKITSIPGKGTTIRIELPL
jgi:signal transduction histidine kinase